MRIDGRSISPGVAEATVLKYNEAFSFLGGVIAATGELKVMEGNIADKIFVFPKGKGSTVGSFVMYDLMVHGKAPAAVVNETAETIVTTGAVISSIPMVDSIDVDILEDGDKVTVNGTEGFIDIHDVKHIRVVSSAIVVGGKVLILKRPETAKSFPSNWSLVAGKIEGEEDIFQAARREIMEETQIVVDEPDVVHEKIYVREGNTIWEVYPLMYFMDSAEPILNKENVAFDWVSEDDLKKVIETVPETYQVVNTMLDAVRKS